MTDRLTTRAAMDKRNMLDQISFNRYSFHPLTVLYLVLVVGFFPILSLKADSTGTLPQCPAPMGVYLGNINLANTGVFTNPTHPHLPPSWIAVSIGSWVSENLGGPEECASQNWHGADGEQHDMPKATNSHAEPSEISASNFSTNVTFYVESADQPGPFDVNFWDCFPPANFGDLDCLSGGITYANMAFRKANGAGVFTGPWTFITSSNNPGFLFTRLTDCPSPLSQLTHPARGAPCTYQLDFAVSPDGVPIMQAPHQVVIFTTAGSNPQTVNGFTSNDYTSHVTFPLLLTPGSSSSIEADANDFNVTSGEEVILSFHLNGNIDPSNLPVLVVESAAPGTSHFSGIGEVPTDINGDATFPVTPTVDTQYRARLNGSAGGEIVVSNSILIEVEPAGDPAPGADLELKMIQCHKVLVPDDINIYSMRIKNSGPMVSTETMISDLLPDNSSFVGSTPAGICSEAGGLVTCDLGTLDLDVATVVDLDVTVESGANTPFINAASVAASLGDPVTTNNDVEVTARIVDDLIFASDMEQCRFE